MDDSSKIFNNGTNEIFRNDSSYSTNNLIATEPSAQFIQDSFTDNVIASSNHIGDPASSQDRMKNPITFSTAYSGPRIRHITPTNPLSRVYLPHESTAYTGLRGGYLYGSELLYHSQNRELSAEQSPTSQISMEISTLPTEAEKSDFLEPHNLRSRHYKTVVAYGIAALTICLLSLSSYRFFFHDNIPDLPAATVRQYFIALSENRADDALRLGQTLPDDMRFLSADILRLQNSLAPLKFLDTKRVKLLSTDHALVEFRIQVGDQIQQGKIDTEKYQGKWLLSHSAILISRENIIQSTNIYGPDLITIDDKSLSKIQSHYYFFPGMHALSLKKPQSQSLVLSQSHFILPPNFSEISFPPLGMHIARDPHTGNPSLNTINHVQRAMMLFFKHCSKSQTFQNMHCHFPIPPELAHKKVKSSLQWNLPLLDKNRHLPLDYNYGPISTDQFISYIQVTGTIKLPWTLSSVDKTQENSSGTILLPIQGRVNILSDKEYVFSFK